MVAGPSKGIEGGTGIWKPEAPPPKTASEAETKFGHGGREGLGLRSEVGMGRAISVVHLGSICGEAGELEGLG